MTTSTVRLWDHGFKFLATEQVNDDRVHELDDLISITIRGDGPIHKAARAYLDHEAWDRNLYITIDPEPTRLDEYKNRRGGTITQLEVSEHDCECGTKVPLTTITACGYSRPPNDHVIHPPRGYGIGIMLGGNGQDTIIGCWATPDEARQARDNLRIVALGNAPTETADQ